MGNMVHDTAVVEAILEAAHGPAPVANMSWTSPNRNRRQTIRPEFVPTTHPAMPPLTDGETHSINRHETRQDQRDLSFQTPPLAGASGTVRTATNSRSRLHAHDTRSPTFEAQDHASDMPSPSSNHAIPSRTKRKGRRSVGSSDFLPAPKRTQRSLNFNYFGDGSIGAEHGGTISPQLRDEVSDDEAELRSQSGPDEALERDTPAPLISFFTATQSSTAVEADHEDVDEDDIIQSHREHNNETTGFDRLDTSSILRMCHDYEEYTETIRQFQSCQKLLAAQLLPLLEQLQSEEENSMYKEESPRNTKWTNHPVFDKSKEFSDNASAIVQLEKHQQLLYDQLTEALKLNEFHNHAQSSDTLAQRLDIKRICKRCHEYDSIQREKADIQTKIAESRRKIDGYNRHLRDLSDREKTNWADFLRREPEQP